MAASSSSPPRDAEKLWKLLIAEGEKHGIETRAIGLAARDSLRFEAGMPLHGHEISSSINPIEAGFKWACGLDKDFVGKAAVEKIIAEGAKRKLVGDRDHGRSAPRGLRRGGAQR